jgi:hypothetical protein
MLASPHAHATQHEAAVVQAQSTVWKQQGI